MPNRPTNTEGPQGRSIVHQIVSTLTGNLFAYLLTFYNFFCLPTAAGKEIFYPPQNEVSLRLVRAPVFVVATISLVVIILYLLHGGDNSPTPLDEYIWLLALIAIAVFLAFYTYIIVGGGLPLGPLVKYFCYYVSCVFVLSTLAILFYPSLGNIWFRAGYELVNRNSGSGLWQSLVMWGATSVFILYANILGYILCVHPIITFRQVGKISTTRLVMFYGILWMLVVPTIVVVLFVFYLVPLLNSLAVITD